MGFCRRCGDIVSGDRCKCGGTAVAASTHFSKPFASGQSADKWSKTYVSRDKSPERKPTTTSSVAPQSTGGRWSKSTSEAPSSPTRRFPRPLSYSSTSSTAPFGSSSSSSMGNRVSTHIASSTSRPSRPPSPLKHSTTPAPESDILPSLYGSSLTKVYGSVLQPPDSLATYSCAICDTQFQPDATIYPDPNNPTSTDRFLCLTCFTANGGSKGNCPTCSRPVLAIKSQGGFVQASGKVWHKQCFNCVGCHKNIGDAPIVNLLGQPSCVDCFDGCLKNTTPKKKPESVTSSPTISTIGMSSSRMPGENRPRESSPIMEELEQRLGIRSRETSPALDELDKRLSSLTSKERYTPTRPSSRYSSYRSPDQSPSPISATRDRRDSSCSPTRPSIGQQLTGSTARYSLADSPKPIRRTLTGSSSTAATEEAVEQMKRRFLRESMSSVNDDYPTTPSPRRVRRPRSSASLKSPASPHIMDTQPFSDYGSPLPSTPDLLSDISDSATQTSLPSSPPPSNDHEKEPVEELPSPKPLKIKTKRLSRGDDLDPPQMRARAMSTPSGSPMVRPISQASPFTPSKQISEPEQSVSPSTCCAKCGGGLFSVKEGGGSTAGKFVTVPDDENPDGGRKSKVYHTECFRCTVCDGLFREGGKGQAIYVRAAGGPCHTECAPPERVVLKSAPNTTAGGPSIFSKKSTSTTSGAAPSRSTTWDSSPSKPSRPLSAVAPSSLSFPRFGSSNTCPGCHKSVSPMERGVVPGPQGTRWHASCLVCGGKKEFQGLFAPRRKKDEPGCGKKLDSAAKGDMEGGVWCRDCLLLLPSTMRDSSLGSPTRQPAIIPSHTGGGGVAAQYTGTTTIARQFTGMGSGGEASLNRQMTGGGLNPTRQLSSSPTKQLGTAPRALGRPRPKSVIGFRMDENGKVGGLLNRQTTGSSAASGQGWRY